MPRRLYALMTMPLFFACGGETASVPPAAGPEPATPAASAAPPPVETPPATAAKPALADLEKKAITDWYAAFNAHDTKKLMPLYSADAVAASPGPGGWHETKGGEAISSGFAPLFASMPDLKAAPVRILQKSDLVVVEWAATGTNTGDIMGGPPTNKKAGILGADVFWFAPDGLITRSESFHDQATIAQQLGKMPGKPRDIATLPAGEPVWVMATGMADEDRLVDQWKSTWPAAWNKHDVKAYGDVINDDSAHIPLDSPVDYVGRAALIKEFQMNMKAFPDLTNSIDKAWGFAPDTIVAEMTFTGTMKGSMGPLKATNKSGSSHGLEIDEMKAGKVQRGVTYANGMEFLSSIGALPKPADKNAKAAAPTDKPAKTAAPMDKPAKAAPATDTAKTPKK